MSETQEDASQQLTIGEVAAGAGIRASAIRYYESVGLLPEPERVFGQRRYSPEILSRLHLIRIAQCAGFTLEEIGILLDGSEQDDVSDRLQALARSKLPAIETLIANAETMKAWLELAADCRCPTLDACALFGEAAQAALGSGPAAPVKGMLPAPVQAR